MKFLSNEEAKLEPNHTYIIDYIVLPYNVKSHIEQSSASRGSEIDRYAPYILCILSIVITIVLILRRRRKIKNINNESRSVSVEVVDNLSDLERKIINILVERGGEIYQSELYRLLKIPRTTLWRYIRRLEDRGIVRIKKVNRLNKIVLVKDFGRYRNHQS